LYQKLLKSDTWFSSYSRKCRECFLRHSVMTYDGVAPWLYISLSVNSFMMIVLKVL